MAKRISKCKHRSHYERESFNRDYDTKKEQRRIWQEQRQVWREQQQIWKEQRQSWRVRKAALVVPIIALIVTILLAVAQRFSSGRPSGCTQTVILLVSQDTPKFFLFDDE